MDQALDDIKEPVTILGRDNIVESIFETMLRVEKPNVILTGEPGTGKTAIVRYIKYLINERLAPPGLQDYKVDFLNLNDLLAGPGYRGVFEERCKDEFRKYIGKSVIVFIDEFHAAENLGAMNDGKAPGFGNFLKPLTTTGKVRIIGATTNKEYENMTDAALKRRFRRINVPETNEEVTKEIIKLKTELFNVDDIKIEEPEELTDSIYSLSTKINGFNPDKAVDIVDIVFAKARLQQIETLNSDTAEVYLSDIFHRKQELPDYEVS